MAPANPVSEDRGETIRILRKLRPPAVSPWLAREQARTLLVCDVETEGLDPLSDAIIELAMRPLTYCVETGRVLAVHDAYVGLQDPGRPLRPEITALTGLTDADLRGCSLDFAMIDSMVDASDLILAHAARFDRPRLERLTSSFVVKPWACSFEDVDWRAERLESGKLAFIAALGFGFFYDGHRALDDVDAVCEILGRKRPVGEGTVLAAILQSAREGATYLCLSDTAFDDRHKIKARGFRWVPSQTPAARHWRKVVKPGDSVEDIALDLVEACIRGAVRIVQVTAFDRFTDREDQL